MQANDDIAIVGAGRLGSTLARALIDRGYPLVAIASREMGSARLLAAELGIDACSAAEACRAARWLFLTVPDDALAQTVASLPFSSGQRVVHCSGALALSTLEPGRALGALAGCLHPLQSFPLRTLSAEHLSGITCGVEGDGALQDELTLLCGALGAQTLSLVGVDRARYHAAAVFASNYLVALSAAAARAFELAGLQAEQARTALAPLMRGTSDNIGQLPLADALTGPVARGDVETVRAHLSALQGDAALVDLYCGLGRQLLALPLALDDAQRAALTGLFERA